MFGKPLEVLSKVEIVRFESNSWRWANSQITPQKVMCGHNTVLQLKTAKPRVYPYEIPLKTTLCC